MLKNAIISILLTTIIFMLDAYQNEFSISVCLSVLVIIFASIYWIEYHIELEVKKYKAWKKFQRTVNRKIALNQPTKVS